MSFISDSLQINTSYMLEEPVVIVADVNEPIWYRWLYLGREHGLQLLDNMTV